MLKSVKRNQVMHNRLPSVYQGDYQVTRTALDNYGTTKEKFGTTDICLNDGSFNVKDYQYVLENKEVGMYLIPVNDYGTIRKPDGTMAWSSQLVDTYIRNRMHISQSDPLYAFIFFFHPELNSNTIAGFAKTEKIEMGITHLGAYYGNGVTSNSPPLYHNRRWGVDGEVFNKFGYPANVMIISMCDVPQPILNKNFLIVDKFLNYGIRFPKDYKNSKFRTVDINTSLMFYRDWIREKNYLKKDKTWFTYCAAHKTLVATVALNLPHNKKSFKTIFGDDGESFYNDFCTNYYELTGYEFTSSDETDFEPLWVKEGFKQDQIRPFKNKKEYKRFDKARRHGKLNTFKGFKALKPTEATGWGPQYAADVIFDFVQAYADFLDAGAITSCAAIMGFYKPVKERLGISGIEYLINALPILEIIMQAHTKIYLPRDSNPIYSKSEFYKQTFEELYLAFGGTKKNLTTAIKNLKHIEHYNGKLKYFVSFLLIQNQMLPEFLAWWSLQKVRENWSIILSEPISLPEDAYTWLMTSVQSYFEHARQVMAREKNKIEFNAPPAITHMIGIGMFGNNKYVKLKTICTVMDSSELELKT